MKQTQTPQPGASSSPARLRWMAAACAVGLLGPVLGSKAMAQPDSPPAGGVPTAPPAEPPPPPQIPAELEPFEGRPIRRIEFVPMAGLEGPGAEGAGPAPIEASIVELARNQLRLREGAAFSTALVSQDMSRLNRLGRFSRVESRVQLLDDGSVILYYDVVVQPLITAIEAVGNRALNDQDIAAMVDVLVGTPVDPTQLERAARRIEGRYREKGYFNALVTIDEKELAESGIVLLRVREGERTRVSDIRYQGNVSFSGEEIGTVVKTREVGIIQRGPLDNELLDEDVSSIIRFYRDRGYLDVRADRLVTPSPDGREAVVAFVIDEGPAYTLRDVQVIYDRGSERVLSDKQMLGMMLIKPGDVYSEQSLRRSVDAVQNAYLQMGYVDAEVRRRELREPGQPLVDVLLSVNEGRRFRAGEVTIQGNNITRDDVVRRNVRVQSDRWLDGTAVKETQRLLGESKLYAPPRPGYAGPKATIQQEDPNNPGYRDVLVEVEETNTGSFTVGVGLSSDSGVLGTVAITQRNFDVSDPPETFEEFIKLDAFRGGGQTFSIQALPGDRVQAFSVGISDPYLFESDYSGSANVSYRRRVYRAYDETRAGARFELSQRFGSRWSVGLPVRIEQVELSDIDADAPTDYFKFSDSGLVDSIGVRLTRSSYDSLTSPSRGTKIEFSVNQFGFIGDEAWTSFQAEWASYFKLDEDALGRRTTLQLSTRAGYIPQDSDEVPFYERFYLGGQSFRGFDFRAVAPIGIRNDNGQVSDETVGGTFLFFAGAEVRKPIYEDTLSIVGFVDTGTVDDGFSLSNYRVSVGTGLRILVPALTPVPLAFDIAIPILKEETDETRFFTFSVDVPFR